MSKYPEHEKLKATDGGHLILGEFYDYLCEQGYILATWGDDDYLSSSYVRPEELIAGFYGIDQQKLEAEKQQMIAEIQAMQGG